MQRSSSQALTVNRPPMSDSSSADSLRLVQYFEHVYDSYIVVITDYHYSLLSLERADVSSRRAAVLWVYSSSAIGADLPYPNSSSARWRDVTCAEGSEAASGRPGR